MIIGNLEKVQAFDFLEHFQHRLDSWNTLETELRAIVEQINFVRIKFRFQILIEKNFKVRWKKHLEIAGKIGTLRMADRKSSTK